MAGTIVVDRLESDASYASSINIASPVIVSNTFAFPAGSASAPAISPTGDNNTGIFFPAADTIALTEGGTEVLRISNTANVGIGTINPDQRLSVSGNISLTAGSNKFVRIGSATNYSYDVMSAGDDFQIREAELDNKVRLRIKYNATSSLAGQLQLPIEGSSTLYNAYTCRAWVNFFGTGTPGIRKSGNVSSITDLATGEYRINFSTAMPDSEFCALTGPVDIGDGAGALQLWGIDTSYVSVRTRYAPGGAYDWGTLFIAIVR